MGSDQVEGIVRHISSATRRRRQGSGSSQHSQQTQPQTACHCPHCPRVRYQRLKCDCKCVTCTRSPQTSDRDLDESLLPSFAAPSSSSTDMEMGVITTVEAVSPTPPTLSVCPIRHQHLLHQAGESQQAPQQPHAPFFQPQEGEEISVVSNASCAPCARHGHSLTEFCPGHFLLFGGQHGNSYFNDLFVLIRRTITQNHPSMPSWTELRPLIDPPSPRMGHSCHLHHTKDMLVFFGGSDGQSWFNDLYTLSLRSVGIDRSFKNVEVRPHLRHSVPCARRSHTLVPYTEGRCVLFGGHARVSLQDVWMLEKDLSWSELTTIGKVCCPYAGMPESRYSHSSVIYHDKMYVFGGFCASGPTSESVWELNLKTLVWSEVETVGSLGPCARFGHSASLIPPRMIVFGGMDGFPKGRSLNDAFELHLETFEWRPLMDATSGICDGGDERTGTPFATTAGTVTDRCCGGSSTLTPLHQRCCREGTPTSTMTHHHAGGDGVLSSSVAHNTHTTPQPRRSHAAALDSSAPNGSVIIFGGLGDDEVHVHDECCFEMEVTHPTLRDMTRNWLASKVFYPRTETPSAPNDE